MYQENDCIDIHYGILQQERLWMNDVIFHPFFDKTKMLMGNLGIKDVIFPVKCLISSVLREEMSIRGE